MKVTIVFFCQKYGHPRHMGAFTTEELAQGFIERLKAGTPKTSDEAEILKHDKIETGDLWYITYPVKTSEPVRKRVIPERKRNLILLGKLAGLIEKMRCGDIRIPMPRQLSETVERIHRERDGRDCEYDELSYYPRYQQSRMLQEYYRLSMSNDV